MSSKNKRSNRERYVWVTLVSLLFIATASSFLLSSIQLSSKNREVDDLQVETEVVESEISSFAQVADEYEQTTQAVANCEAKLENLRLGHLEYVLAGGMLLEQANNMIDYGITAGDPSTIFVATPQVIQGAQEYVSIANGFQC